MVTQFDSMWNDDYEKYSQAPQTTTEGFTLEVQNDNNVFGEWMATSPTTWIEAPFADLGLSYGSTGSRSSMDDGSWSPFEESLVLDTTNFTQSDEHRDSFDENFLESPLQTNFDVNWTPEDLNPVLPWVESVKTTKHSRSDDEDEGYGKSEPKASQSPASVDEPASPPARRSIKATRSFVKALKGSKRVKKETTPATESKPSKRPKLMTTMSANSFSTSRPKANLRSVSTSSSNTTLDSRTNHNLIEKQYRNRLNLQFESLLESLPKELSDKRVGKAEVLVNANQYIQDLEKGLKALEQKNANLEANMKTMNRKWLGLGGCAFRKEER
ncbi:hypothetical protein B0J14DRAFT_646481 [Halenospora varia]|nr:hypothetical protein B0J14DRAFT_646481 [Halenospora varia]